MKKWELANCILSVDEPYDRNNAIIELHPGASSTEPLGQWYICAMIYTHVLRATWIPSRNTLDYQAGEEAGIKECHFVDQRP